MPDPNAGTQVPCARWCRYTFLRRIGRWTTANLSGWKMGIVIAALTSSIVLIANIGFTLWGVTHSDLPMAGGIGGSCDKVEEIQLWRLHLGINAFSTLMLSGSNYTQQCLAAPSRHEVDVAHSKRKWLDIGVPSLRNLRCISKKRLLIWLLLAVSSIPLHLM